MASFTWNSISNCNAVMSIAAKSASLHGLAASTCKRYGSRACLKFVEGPLCFDYFWNRCYTHLSRSSVHMDLTRARIQLYAEHKQLQVVCQDKKKKGITST